MKTKPGIKYIFILAAMAALFILPESLFFDSSFSVCQFKNLTGLECPLCGMTRSAFHLIRLHPALAINYNPLVLFVPFLLLAEILCDAMIPGAGKIRKILWILFGAGLIVIFILRLT